MTRTGYLTSARARRLALLATITGSGVAFLDSTVATVALPQMARQLGGGLATQQWVLDGYLLTLGSLVLVGGALGDRYGPRRVYEIGLVAFALTSLAVGLAPTATTVVLARLLQGVAAALLVPGSLAIISALFSGADRGRAIGAWAGWTGMFIAAGPFAAGLLVDNLSNGWRWAFLVNLPIVAVALVLTRVGVPYLPGRRSGRLDWPGALLVTAGLGLLVYPLIEVARLSPGVVAALLTAGAVALMAFLLVERRGTDPMLPLTLFQARSFAAGNVVTFVIYAGLNVQLFLLVVVLQEAAGWSALAAGASGLPVTLALLLLSPRLGGVVARVGGRPLLAAGGVLAAVGMALMLRVEEPVSYLTQVLPALLVFAGGLVLIVAPITTTVLSQVPPHHTGSASGVNNAVARVGGLLGIAVVPLLAGLSTASASNAVELLDGFHAAMAWAAGLCLVGAGVAWFGLTPEAGRAQPS